MPLAAGAHLGPSSTAPIAVFSCLVRFAVATTVLIGSATPLSAQTDGDYLRLIDRYVQDPDGAVRTLASWTRKAIDNGVEACFRTATASTAAAGCSTARTLAAAMLHSDLATAIISSDPGAAAFHVRTARRLLDRVQDRPLFQQRWYEFIAMLYVSNGRFLDATAIANEGLAGYPRAANLYAARAAVAELRIAFDRPNLRGEVIRDDRTNLRVTRALEAAAADYRRALDLDPQFAAARLRIGWIHLLLQDRRAPGELRTLIEQTTDRSVRYLAHLFLGAIAEREKRLADALREYQAARDAGPEYQTACVALSHVEDALGQSTRARATASACAALEQTDDDPWSRLAPFDPGTLDWLHAEAQRQ
jgi:tetratricopeptide (TPR) repeat protein